MYNVHCMLLLRLWLCLETVFLRFLFSRHSYHMLYNTVFFLSFCSLLKDVWVFSYLWRQVKHFQPTYDRDYYYGEKKNLIRLYSTCVFSDSYTSK